MARGRYEQRREERPCHRSCENIYYFAHVIFISPFITRACWRCAPISVSTMRLCAPMIYRHRRKAILTRCRASASATEMLRCAIHLYNADGGALDAGLGHFFDADDILLLGLIAGQKVMPAYVIFLRELIILASSRRLSCQPLCDAD